MTPREIVSELDRYIVGQRNAKRAVAIALRNRWRRQQVPEELRDEIAPKNIIMIGPTGVGKTEISRRLAKLAQAPFLKVEASKFTEVGYVGRDVESMIRDLAELAIKMVQGGGAGEGRSCARASSPRSACSICCCRRRGRRNAASSRWASERRRAGEASASDARQAAPHAARGQARRAHGRARGHQVGHADGRGADPAGHGGDGVPAQGHVRQPHAQEDQEAAR